MDYRALASIIDPIVENVEAARREWQSQGADWSRYEIYRQSALRGISVAQTIAESVPNAPARADFEPDPSDGFPLTSTHAALLRLQGLLRNGEQLEKLLPEAGPARILSTLEHRVRQSAIPLWNDGYRRAAIHAAASQLENWLQAKLGREDVSGAKLVREAFSLTEPRPGKARLRFPGMNEASETYRSTHDGAASFGAGCFQVIRNTAAHGGGELAEEVAIEHLASLSLLARLIEFGNVVRSEGEPEHEPDAAEPFA